MCRIVSRTAWVNALAGLVLPFLGQVMGGQAAEGAPAVLPDAAKLLPGSRTAAPAGIVVPLAGRRRPGRPRSAQADRAILAAALDLLADHGPGALHIEQVAARAGVGKATIYRRWPGKEDMLVDALGELRTPLPQAQGRSVRADLVALLGAICRQAADPRRARLYALVQGEGEHYPRLLARYAETVLRPCQDAVKSVLRRGIATGELREDTDLDAAAFLLSGAVLASMYGAGQADARSISRVVAELLRGLGAR